MNGARSVRVLGAMVTLVVITLLSGCSTLDRDKASAYLTARTAQVTTARETAEIMCRRGTLSATDSAAAVQTQTAEGRSARGAATAAEQALLASSPPERTRTAVTALTRAAAEVESSSAAVSRSCASGSTTSSSGASRRTLELAVGRFQEQAALFQREI